MSNFYICISFFSNQPGCYQSPSAVDTKEVFYPNPAGAVAAPRPSSQSSLQTPCLSCPPYLHVSGLCPPFKATLGGHAQVHLPGVFKDISLTWDRAKHLPPSRLTPSPQQEPPEDYNKSQSPVLRSSTVGGQGSPSHLQALVYFSLFISFHKSQVIPERLLE